MRLEWKHYTTDLVGTDTSNFVIPEGYTLYGIAFDRHHPNHCHKERPVLILTKYGKYYAQCACGVNLTDAFDCGNDALTAFRNATR